MKCDYCDGAKLDNGEPCPMCEGRGVVCDHCGQASAEPLCEPCREKKPEPMEV